MLLHHNTGKSLPYCLSYKTRMYVRDTHAPMSWKKKNNKLLLPGETAILISVVENLDFEQSPSFNMGSFLQYNLDDKTTLVSLEVVFIKGLDVVRGTFDVFRNKMNEMGELDFLVITGASRRTDLTATIFNETLHSENFIVNSPTPIDLSQLLQTVVGFEQISATVNKTLLAHCNSPHNPLFGVFLEILQKESNENNLDFYRMFIFTSSERQIMILVNLIYDAIPSRIAITTTGLEISKINIQPQENELSPIIGESRMETDQDDSKSAKDLEKVTKFGMSLNNQMSLLLEYFDFCMQSMAKSKLRDVVEKIGVEIDISAPGKDHFSKFINNFDEEALRACNIFYSEDE